MDFFPQRFFSACLDGGFNNVFRILKLLRNHQPSHQHAVNSAASAAKAPLPVMSGIFRWTPAEVYPEPAEGPGRRFFTSVIPAQAGIHLDRRRTPAEVHAESAERPG